MEYCPAGEGGAVPYILYPGDVPSSLQERVYPGPQSQLILLNDLGVPPECHPDITHKVTRAAQAASSPPPNHPDNTSRSLRGPITGDTETQGARGTEEPMDIGRLVEAS